MKTSLIAIVALLAACEAQQAPSPPQMLDAAVSPSSVHCVVVVEESTFACPNDSNTVLVSLTTERDFQTISGTSYKTASGCLIDFHDGVDLDASMGDEVTIRAAVGGGTFFGCPPEPLSARNGCSDTIDTAALACEMN